MTFRGLIELLFPTEEGEARRRAVLSDITNRFGTPSCDTTWPSEHDIKAARARLIALQDFCSTVQDGETRSDYRDWAAHLDRKIREAERGLIVNDRQRAIEKELREK